MDPIGMLAASVAAAAALGVVFAAQSAFRRRRLAKRRWPDFHELEARPGTLRNEPAQWAAFELSASRDRGPIRADQPATTTADLDGVH